MQEPDFPGNEAERLRALRLLDILDTEPEARFDRITHLAQQLFDAPIVLISLVDADRQWFKSRQGLDVCETPRNISFCGHAILGEDILHVPDATQDPRFWDNPLVIGEPDIRFYAGAPLRVAGGARIGTLCLIDRRVRKLSEEELANLRHFADWVEDELNRAELSEATSIIRAHEERLRAVIDNVAETILTVDAAGRVLSANASAEDIFARPAERLSGIGLHELLPRITIEQCAEHLRQDMGDSSGVPKWSHLTVARRNDGSEIPVNLTVTLLRQQADISYIVSVRHISDAERLDLMKREFISIVSHELRTPLTSIRGALGLVIGGVAGRIPGKADELLTIAERNCERLISLVNDILDLEKIELGRLSFNPVNLDLRSAIESVVALSNDYATGFEVSLKTAISLPHELRMRVDESRLAQVLTNLISNAVKFSPPQGTVEVAAELNAEAESVRISVRDQGPGIPPEMREYIFEKFRQLDSPNALSKGGSGLGLSIAKAITEAFGGTIGVECPVEGGSVFFLNLPITSDTVAR